MKNFTSNLLHMITVIFFTVIYKYINTIPL